MKFFRAMGCGLLIVGCDGVLSELQQTELDDRRSLRIYGEPIDVNDAPLLFPKDSTKRQVELLIEGSGELLSGVIKSTDKGPEGSSPELIDGENRCLLEPGTKVWLHARFTDDASKKQYLIVGLDEPCDKKNEDFLEGNILQDWVKVVKSKDQPEVVKNNQSNSQSNPTAAQTGCSQVGQVLIDDDNRTTVNGTLARFRRNPLLRNAACVSDSNNVCAMNGESFRAAGRVPREDRSAWLQVALEIKGQASKWSINVSGHGATFPEKRFEGDVSGENVIPFVQFIPVNSWRKSTRVEIAVQGYDDNGDQVGNECLHSLRLISPLVFDFSGADFLTTIHPALTQVRFDLNGDGALQQTGWIQDSSAFLAIDLTGNGLIESGRELFGEATIMANGELAENGYVALSQYDENGDGYIDADDPVFDRLLLWFDRNQDGLSQEDELISLREAGVTRIAVTYEGVAEKQQNTDGVMGLGNRTLYQSRFYGPEVCGVEGCRSYDVYFQTIDSIVQK